MNERLCLSDSVRLPESEHLRYWEFPVLNLRIFLYAIRSSSRAAELLLLDWRQLSRFALAEKSQLQGPNRDAN